MRLITWNIQCGKGCDGVIDLARIVAVAKEMADADVYCFQEVSDNFANFDDGANQPAQLAALLPDHRAVFRPAIESIDADGRIHRFGNMTLSRLPAVQVVNHLLPWPDANAVRSMRRHALEVTVQTAFGPLRVVNTHLEYHATSQREAQIVRLLELQEESSTGAMTARPVHVEPYTSQTLASSSLLCGDFNFDVSDPQHAMIEQSVGPGINYRDAWTVCHGDKPHVLTCGLYDRVQWPNGPDCRDFIFVTEDISRRVFRVEVNEITDASDHQPILIELAD
ncbi:MAG: endonuclease/exonuclease/phosphatase family protein [Proteobacteria bacterium]|nr:endonuclease/exonuclease/phosphatase family protein [Pseudomonadota bacterium]